MKKVFLSALIIILAIACSSDRTPKGILPKQKMINFLIDVHLTEAKLNSLGIPTDSAKSLFNLYQKELYEKHGIDDSVYQVSHVYYLENPKKMTEIYAAVVDSLSLRERLKKVN